MTPDRRIAEAETLRQGGDHAAAAALLTPLAEAGAPDALRLLGLCRLSLGDIGAALPLLERAHAAAPDDPRTRLHLGMCLHAAGRFAQAAAWFRSCLPDLPHDPAPPLNLASSLLATGDAAGAVQAASEACHRAPDLAAAHYTYGLAWLAANDPVRAEQAVSAALRLSPRWPDAWVNLGMARYRLGDVEQAQGAMRTALALAPGHRAATANLAVFLRLTGDAEAAETLLRDLLARDPDAAEARLNLAADLLGEERAEDALTLLRHAMPSTPHLRLYWQLQEASALLQLCRTGAARAVLDQIGPVPQAALPLLLWRRVLLAVAENDLGRARTHAGDMEAALHVAADAMLPEHRIMAHFDLAKFWSGRDDPDRAFTHWSAGHEVLRRFQPFSRDAWRGFVDATIAAFDADRLRRGPRAGNDDPLPVFILGLPRSGTTLAERILSAHRDVHGAGERPALGRAFAALGGGEDAVERVAALDGPALDAAAAEYLAELRALAPARRIVDKMPGNSRFLGLAALMLPGARVIHCVRDLRDVGLSIFTFRFHGHHPYAHDLGDLGWYIGQHERLMRHWQTVLPGRLLVLALTDWVDDFDRTLARVLDFLDLPPDPACRRFHEDATGVRTVSRAQVREPVNRRGLGRWKRYEAQLAPLIAELDAAGLL